MRVFPRWLSDSKIASMTKGELRKELVFEKIFVTIYTILILLYARGLIMLGLAPPFNFNITLVLSIIIIVLGYFLGRLVLQFLRIRTRVRKMA